MKSLSIELSDEDMAGVEKEAAEAHLSPAEFVKDSIQRILRARYEWQRWDERAKKADWDEFKRILAKVPDAPPMPGDELPEGWKQTEK